MSNPTHQELKAWQVVAFQAWLDNPSVELEIWYSNSHKWVHWDRELEGDVPQWATSFYRLEPPIVLPEEPVILRGFYDARLNYFKSLHPQMGQSDLSYFRSPRWIRCVARVHCMESWEEPGMGEKGGGVA